MLSVVKRMPIRVSKRKVIPEFRIPPWLKKCNLYRLGTPEGNAALKALLEAPRQTISVDTETTGNNPRKDLILVASVAWSATDSFLFPIRKPAKEGNWVPAQSWAQQASALKALFEHHEVAMQNHIFDERILDGELGKHLCYDFRAVRDTMLAAYLEDGSQPNGLKALAQAKFGYETIDFLSVDFVDPVQLLYYACQDALITWKLDYYFKSLKDSPYSMLLYPVEMQVAACIKEMEGNGILIDQNEIKRQQTIITKEIADLERKIYAQAGKEFKLDSPAQVGKVLFEDLGVPCNTITEGGKRSTRAEVLEELRDSYPIVNDILNYRHKQKLESQYLDGIAQYIEEDGRVHCSILQNVVPTGRLQAKNPNLMQIPDEVRPCYIPEEGYELLESDYKGIEFRLIVSEAQCRPAIRAIQQGRDTHRMCAAFLYDLPEEKVSSEMRDDSKTTTFGVIYGMEYWSLARRLKISPAEGREKLDRYFRLWTGLKEWIEKEKRLATQRGGSRTAFGRHRSLPDLRSPIPRIRARALRNAVNDRVQGGAADIIKMRMFSTMVAMSKLGCRLLLMVHDSLLFEVPKDRVTEARKVIEENMFWGKHKGFVDMEVEVKHGLSWGGLTKFGLDGSGDVVIKPKGSAFQKEVLVQLRSALLACNACPLRKEARAPVPFKGNLKPKVIIIGRNSGRQEDEAGIPFNPAAPGGAFLDKYLTILGLSRKDVFITNLVKCYTTDDRPPEDECVQICRDRWLLRELKLVRAPWIFLLGNQCVRAVLGVTTPSVTLIHGREFVKDIKGKEVKFVALHHPGYVLRNPEAWEETKRDLVALKSRMGAV